jgi:hypothetical protein
VTYKMKITEYTGELWQGEQVHPDLLERLTGKDDLIEIAHGEPPYQVVIGVPHQAAVDDGQIAEEWLNPVTGKRGRASDEAAALFALASFTSLRDQNIPCKLVVAAHATDHDPNKDLDSPYCQRIFIDSARLLFECHGASKEQHNDLEVTAGSNSFANPVRFGRLLAEALEWRYRVAAQTRPGVTDAATFMDEGAEGEDTLNLPALKTDSLRQAATNQMHALHLEAKPDFRISKDKADNLTEDGRALGQVIAIAIMNYLDVV